MNMTECIKVASFDELFHAIKFLEEQKYSQL